MEVYTSCLTQYEAMIIPSVLVPYIKTIILEHIKMSEKIVPLVSLIPPSISPSPVPGMPSIPKSISLSSVPGMPLPPVEKKELEFIPLPTSPPPPVPKLVPIPITSLVPKLVNDVKFKSAHTICTDWLKGYCSSKSCNLDHHIPSYFKSNICKHWQYGQCRYKSIDCSYAHGSSDLSSNTRTSYKERSRSRSRSRDKETNYNKLR